MIEIEVQNETRQSQERLKFLAVPRIGEGLRLREPDGAWASYDVLDLWYQKAPYGDVWEPYVHVRLTPPEADFGAVLRPDFGHTGAGAGTGAASQMLYPPEGEGQGEGEGEGEGDE